MENNNLAYNFIQFRESQKTTTIGGKAVYDILGESKYLTESELFSLFIKRNGQKS